MPDPEKQYYAPRQWHWAMPALALFVLLFFGGGAIWGVAQIALAMNRTGATVFTPASINQAQASYHETHGHYATNASDLNLKRGTLDPYDLNMVQMLGTCSTGWVAKVQANLTGDVTYLSSTGDQNRDINALKLPGCLTLASLGHQASPTAVKIDTIKVSRTKKGSSAWNGATEAAKATWTASKKCEPQQHAHYQVTVTQQPGKDYTLTEDEKTPRIFETDSTHVYVDGVDNGMSYKFAVVGSCTGAFNTANAKAVTFTQSLPAPHLRITRSNGLYYMLVGASSSDHVYYDIEYKRSYAGGWSTFTSGFINGAVKPSGYYHNYGDTYRARAHVDENTMSDWGPSTKLRSDSNAYYSSFDSYSSY